MEVSRSDRRGSPRATHEAPAEERFGAARRRPTDPGPRSGDRPRRPRQLHHPAGDPHASIVRVPRRRPCDGLRCLRRLQRKRSVAAHGHLRTGRDSHMQLRRYQRHPGVRARRSVSPMPVQPVRRREGRTCGHARWRKGRGSRRRWRRHPREPRRGLRERRGSLPGQVRSAPERLRRGHHVRDLRCRADVRRRRRPERLRARHVLAHVRGSGLRSERRVRRLVHDGNVRRRASLRRRRVRVRHDVVLGVLLGERLRARDGQLRVRARR